MLAARFSMLRTSLATVIIFLAFGFHTTTSAQIATVELATDASGQVRAVLIQAAPDQTFNRDRELLANTETVTLQVEGMLTGKVTPYVNNLRQTPIELAEGRSVSVRLFEGTNVVNLQYQIAAGAPVPSNSISIELDKTGPKLRRAELVEHPTTGSTLLVKFDDDDLNESIATDALSVVRQDKDGTYTSNDKITISPPLVDGDTIRVPILSIPPGHYRLVLDPAKVLDFIGNPTAGATTLAFTVYPERSFGEHVEFTPFAPPKKQEIPKEGFNPGDYVETRVARLFYFRDAHRVAQIINRNIRSYNQAAVTQAQRRAEDSRDDADDAHRSRRQKERAAVRAAEQARNAENQLAQAQQTLAEAQQLDNAIALKEQKLQKLKSSSGTTPADPAPSGSTTIDQQITNLENEIEADKAYKTRNYGDTSVLQGKVGGMQQSVANLRQTELTLRDQWNDAQAIEQRARAKQFRHEVTAAETDPDTYVAGDMHSADPVTQCSLSVIGEGLIQIRGPIKGINKIRTMINQIDSPVGQIKIGVFTVQVNGEDGAKMEKVVGNAEGYIDLSRFLVNSSLNLLRKAIQSEAAMLAEQCQHEGHYQVDRDRRYLYSFFGRDFIDELYEMDSEFLLTENKLLSLHAMDTVSLNRALFILALAKNDVRERIVAQFLASIKTELPDAEFDFRRSSELKPHRSQKHFPFWNRSHLPVSNHYEKEELIYEAVHRNALQRYHFRNFNAFFDTGFVSPDTMNPMQREFIRLAQIFKARLVAEIELKQRVMERGLIEDRSNNDEYKFQLLDPIHREALKLEALVQQQRIDSLRDGISMSEKIRLAIAEALKDQNDMMQIQTMVGAIMQKASDFEVSGVGNFGIEISNLNLRNASTIRTYLASDVVPALLKLEETAQRIESAKWASQTTRAKATAILEAVAPALSSMNQLKGANDLAQTRTTYKSFGQMLDQLDTLVLHEQDRAVEPGISTNLANDKFSWERIAALYTQYRLLLDDPESDLRSIEAVYVDLGRELDQLPGSSSAAEVRGYLQTSYLSVISDRSVHSRLNLVRQLGEETRVDLDHRKLLNFLIDEQEDKFIELVEGTRSHIAVIDQYLKRLSIALEDDFKVQFYDPALVRVREAGRGLPVTLGQIERTTILTNNRDFAKVDPQATMEFDLPKRQIAIKEAFDAAKALVEDTGALINDPTFLSAFQMMGGSQQPTTVKNLVPGQSMSTDQDIMGLVPPPPSPATPGSALQSLVPEPSIFKLETGTGFQIRPVMQPDGDSAVYDFDYMYTTNIREPVRADEKHIGRIRRHFVHTAVQTGNFELREISRYQVALRVSRTGKGVPLLEDIPIVGAVFRPAPSDDSSLQQNIIFGQTNLYPTLYDLMGLRWAQQVVDLDHMSLIESEHLIRGRQKSMRDFVFGEASKRVDEFLNVRELAPRNFRPDLYHPQTMTSPYHPRGYTPANPATDPTGNNYEHFDRRPPEMQDPPYDRYRHRPVSPERIGPGIQPEQIPPRSEFQQLPEPVGFPTGHRTFGNDEDEFQSLLKLQPAQANPLGDLGAVDQRTHVIPSRWETGFGSSATHTSHELAELQPRRVRHLPPTGKSIDSRSRLTPVMQAGFLQPSAEFSIQR